MKRQACMLLCAGLLALGAGALAQTATYVFPYEGFRYTQREDETVLTQTNLGEHEALLKSRARAARPCWPAMWPRAL